MSDEMRAKFQEAEAVGRVDSADLRSSRPTTDTKLDGVGRGRLFVGWIHSLSDSSVPWLFASGHCGSQEPREGTVDHRSDRFNRGGTSGKGHGQAVREPRVPQGDCWFLHRKSLEKI